MRIWYAKGGKGTQNDIGISPTPEQHLKNGSYSMSLSRFDPREMTIEDAKVAGKDTSLYGSFGAQFGAQVWRLAHEVEVGDYIFLETENHHLHAVGIVSGAYTFNHLEGYQDTDLVRLGLHSIPVNWAQITDGQDFIQMGRGDNAVFRNIIEKEELVDLLLKSTRSLTRELAGLGPESDADDSVEEGTEETEEESEAVEKSEQIDAAPVAVTIPPPPAPAHPFHVARNGEVIMKDITITLFREHIAAGRVQPSDHCYQHGMSGWITISEFLKK